MKKFFALFDNSRTTRDENNNENVMYYFRITNMSAEEKAVYKADKGQYYIEDTNGTPMYSVKNQNLGNELVIVRASKPNEKTGVFAWYHKRTEMQILNSLIEQYPALANSNAGFSRLETMAKDQFNGQFTTVTVEDTKSVADF
jgi:hypothetical protein